LKINISAPFDRLADDIIARVDSAADPALHRYVEGERRRAEGEWYGHVGRKTGESGKLRTRTYRTKAGTLRAKVGSDAKYARFLFGDNGKRVLDSTLTEPMRANVSGGFAGQLAKELK